MNFITTFTYPITIKEVYLDMMGHVNNAVYLVLFEEARWDILANHGYGVEKIKQTGLAPTILEAQLKYLKELRLRENAIIETQILSYEKKIGKLQQRIVREGEVCCTLDLTFALFDLKERKLVLPTADWLQAIGVAQH